MKVAFSAIGAYGHVFPMLPLAMAFRDAGHEVVMATAEPFLGTLPLRTVATYDPSLTLEWAVGETRRRHPDLHDDELSIAMFADVTADASIPVTIEVLTSEQPDLVIGEPLHVGALIAASLLGIPAAAFSIGLTPSFYPLVHGAAVGYHRHRWVERGLVPPERALLADVLVDPCPPSLRAPYDDAPCVPIRTVAWRGAATGAVPGWLEQPATTPRVYLTLGTVSFGAVEVLRRTALEIAALDAELLIAVGPEGDPSLLGDLPPQVRCERFVDQAAVLRQVDLIVHHGGTGTVLAALEVGLPQVILPQGADQPFNADLIQRAGAGRSQSNDDYTAGSISQLVGPLLGPCPEREVARRIADEIATMPAPPDVVPSLVARVAGRAREA
ncbi:MAG TPA: glycosyltransferase [Microlunatus sp.]|nr:glycosyltransferase [Microlunatus sp.]